MKRIIWVAVMLVACKDEKPDPTKAGTTVLSWQLADSDRAPLRTAKTSDVQTKVLPYESTLTGDVKVKVQIKLETATVVFTENGKERTHRAPTKVTVEAVDAKDFTLGAHSAKCRGPHDDMNLPPGPNMSLHCIVSARKPRHELAVNFYAYGDGRIDEGNMTNR